MQTIRQFTTAVTEYLNLPPIDIYVNDELPLDCMAFDWDYQCLVIKPEARLNKTTATAVVHELRHYQQVLNEVKLLTANQISRAVTKGEITEDQLFLIGSGADRSVRIAKQMGTKIKRHRHLEIDAYAYSFLYTDSILDALDIKL